MLAFLAVIVVAVAAVAIPGLQLWRPRFGYGWLAAAGGSLIAWGLALAAYTQIPQTLSLFEWQPRVLLPVSPVLTLDTTAWAFLLAVLTLSLAAVLTDVHRSTQGERPGTRWLPLAAGLWLCAVCALASLAGNLVTLALLWTLADLTLLVIGLALAQSQRETELAVVAFALRLASSGIVVWAGVASGAAGTPSALNALDGRAGAALLAAAALRLGLLPPHRPIPEITKLLPAPHALFWLAGSAPGWLALARAGAAGQPDAAGWFLLIGALGLLYATPMWLRAASVRAGLPYWTLAISALALGSAGRGLPFAALAWSICGVLVGGLAALSPARPRRLLPVLLLGALALSGLPFTPNWPGVGLFGAPLYLTLPVYLLGHAFLLIGTVRLALRSVPLPPTAERWVWLIYPLGLALMPAAQFVILWGLRPGAAGGMPAWPGWIETGLSVIGIGLAVLLAAAYLRFRRRLPRLNLAPVFELDGLYRAVWGLFHAAGRAMSLAGWALEGRAGLLWALLVLALLLSLLAQRGSGG